VERGIKKIGEGHGIAYLQIIDDQNKQLSAIGQLTKGLGNNDFNFQEILSGKVRIISRKVNSGDSKILDMAAPLYINKKIAGIVRIGLERARWIRLLRRIVRISLFHDLVVLIAILSMWLCITTKTGISPASLKWNDGWKSRTAFIPGPTCCRRST